MAGAEKTKCLIRTVFIISKPCLSGWHIQIEEAAFHPAQSTMARNWVARRLSPDRGLTRYETARQALCTS